MLFNSLHYLVFLPVVFVLYYAVPHRVRWVLLLVASYYMYMSWNPAYGFLLFCITAINFYLGLLIEGTRDPRERKRYVYISLASLLGPLLLFKYFNFFNDLIASIFDWFQFGYTAQHLKLFLPVGISFHTFQIIGYIADVYSGRVKAEKHLGTFALYVSFFPQLLAGPIERAAHLLPQFAERHHFSIRRITEGLQLILWGCFKKIVIADSLATSVTLIFAHPEQFPGYVLFLGALFFAIQIYADFSGYTDIARGSAKILGFNLSLNFNRPFEARSISDFWQRWHISLTSWFQDYVFRPLYFKVARSTSLRVTTPSRKHFIAFSVATITGLTLLGLWHGAGMNFVVFGLSQSLFLIIYHAIKKWWDKLPYVVANLGTMAMVLIGFVFFRAETVRDGFYILSHMVQDFDVLISSLSIPFIKETLATIGLTKQSTLMSIVGATVCMFVVERLNQKETILEMWRKTPRFLAWGFCYIIIFWILLFGFFDKQPFIYFEF